jgi:hypothetical protein
MPAEYKPRQDFIVIACDMFIAVNGMPRKCLKFHSKTGNSFYVTVNCFCRLTLFYEAM